MKRQPGQCRGPGSFEETLIWLQSQSSQSNRPKAGGPTGFRLPLAIRT